jgi:hypothetical protein
MLHYIIIERPISSSLCKLCWWDRVCESAIEVWSSSGPSGKMWCDVQNGSRVKVLYLGKPGNCFNCWGGQSLTQRGRGHCTTSCLSFVHLCQIPPPSVYFKLLQTKKGNTALIKTGERGHIETARILLDHGADMDYQNKVKFFNAYWLIPQQVWIILLWLWHINYFCHCRRVNQLCF